MKFRNMKIIGALLVVLINLLGAQAAKASPLEEAYMANLDKYVNEVILEAEKFRKVGAFPPIPSSLTSAKYKATVKNMIRSIDKMTVTLRKLEALTAPESSENLEIFLKEYVKSWLELNALYKKGLAPKFKWTQASIQQILDLRIYIQQNLDEMNRGYTEYVARLQAPPTD